MVSRTNALGLFAATLVFAGCLFDLPPPRGDTSDASRPMDAADVPDVSCLSGQLLCNGACIDPNTDTQHCGACTTVCAGSLHAAAVCSAGRCDVTCEVGYKNCDGAPIANGCPVAASTGCGDCNPSGDSCSLLGSASCQFVGRPGVYRCCRSLAVCTPESCGPALRCVHSDDFDSCCAM